MKGPLEKFRAWLGRARLAIVAPRPRRRPLPFAWLWARLSREGRLLATLTFACLLFGEHPAQTDVHVLFFATGALLCASVLFSRAFRLRGVRAELAAARSVALGDELTFRIELVNDTDREYRRLRVEVPRLPWGAVLTQPPSEIAALPAHGRASTQARARFGARGGYQLAPFRAAALLPLALSQGPALATRGARFTVVPRVARVTKVLAGERQRVRAMSPMQAARRGDGSELAGVRPYRPGDPLRQLHARSWARQGSPMVREYEDERFARLAVVVDADADAGAAQVEAALSLAAGIIARACQGEARVHVLVTAEQTVQLPPSGGGALERALELLGGVRARAGFSAQRALAELGPHLTHLSSVVLVAVTWDAERAALVAALAQRGVACEAAVVADRAERTGSTILVPIDAITSGQELAL